MASILVENSSSCAAAVAQIIDITKILILHGILDSRLLFPGVLLRAIIIIFKHLTIKLYKQQSFCASISAIKMHQLRLIINCHLKQTRGFRIRQVVVFERN